MTPSPETDDINAGETTRRMKALSMKRAMRVLLIDDDDIERALIRSRLEARGIRVSEAGNGEEGLAGMAGGPVAVAIVDWQMPVMNGLEFVRRCKEAGHDDTYLIMLTARRDPLDFETGYQAGIDDYLTKDVGDSELIARVHSGLSTFSLRQELREARAQLAKLAGS
jgi:DNA-binding response OmpR family regulator